MHIYMTHIHIYNIYIHIGLLLKSTRSNSHRSVSKRNVYFQYIYKYITNIYIYICVYNTLYICIYNTHIHIGLLLKRIRSDSRKSLSKMNGYFQYIHIYICMLYIYMYIHNIYTYIYKMCIYIQYMLCIYIYIYNIHVHIGLLLKRTLTSLFRKEFFSERNLWVFFSNSHQSLSKRNGSFQ